MERVMDKKREDAIVDAPRYECAEMATRFALSWLDRTRYHLKHIKRSKRSYYHDKLLVEVTAIEQALVDLVIKTKRAYDGHGLTKNNDPIYKPRFEDSGVRNRIETAKAKGRRVPPLTPEEELAATVARQKEAE